MKRIYGLTIDSLGGGWKVVELGSGKVACLNGFPLHRLSRDEAGDRAVTLNRIEGNPLPPLG